MSKYTDIEKANALSALDVNGGNVLKTAIQLDIPRMTLVDWSKGKKINADVTLMRQEQKQRLVEKLEDAAEALAENVLTRAGSIANNENIQHVSTALAIVVDKLQLLKGEATSRTESVQTTPEQRKARIAELKAQLGKAS